MRHKMITLCLNSFEIAQKMPNFSAWVRKKILEESNMITNDPIFHLYQCPVCIIKVESEQRFARHCSLCNYPMKYKGVKE